jgi:hypothetical protein
MRFLFSVAVAAALFIVPLQGGAVQTGRTIEYSTTYSLVYPYASPGAYLGRMSLHFTGNGDVIGLYRDEYVGNFIQVAGGLNGTKLWLSFGGAAGTRRFEGTLHEDDTITGSLMQWNDVQTYAFKAAPSTS